MEMEEYAETRSVTLSWRISNLKQLFDASKGESKSRCLKSSLFDSNRWQIFFYPNSGHESYCSLYLSCEPTEDEKARGLEEKRRGRVEATGAAAKGSGIASKITDGGANKDGAKVEVKQPWKREGKFKFTFEARSLDKRNTFKSMEATDHSFSDTARNWGYQNFWKRADAYYNNAAVKDADAMMIICTIVYSPTPPSPPPLPRLLIPKDLVNAYANLFDDPDYSDVVFKIRPAKGGKERKIFAIKKILSRSSYFDIMFSSGFHESNPILPRGGSSISSASSLGDFDDRLHDDEDELDEDDDSDAEGTESEEEEEFNEQPEIFSHQKNNDTTASEDDRFPLRSSDDEDGETDETLTGSRELVVRERDREESTNEFVDAPLNPIPTVKAAKKTGEKVRGMDGRPRFEVVITDANYTTFRALLYYLYTDSIEFAPLSSTYQAALEQAEQSDTPFPYPTRASFLRATFPSTTSSINALPINACSVKAIYRLSDKIGLNDLKNRAFSFLVSSLTVQNITYEVFGSFALRFDEVKKVEISFLLEKWNEVRSSSSMKKVFNHIRVGRYPGFEKVLGKILENLEYRPDLNINAEKV